MEKHITLPLTEELAKTLKAGDTVYLTGTIYTSRDAGHKRMCETLARGEALPFDPQAALEEAKGLAKPADFRALLYFFAHLEILTPRWAEMLRSAQPGSWSADYRKLARYFIERYWLQAISYLDLTCRVKMIIAGALIVGHLGGDPINTAQLYSKEIENDPDNRDAILDAAYCHPAFTDANLFGLLLK